MQNTCNPTKEMEKMRLLFTRHAHPFKLVLRSFIQQVNPNLFL